MVKVYMLGDILVLSDTWIAKSLLSNQRQLDRDKYGAFTYYEIDSSKLDKAFRGLLKRLLNSDMLVETAELGTLYWFILSHLEHTNELLVEY